MASVYRALDTATGRRSALKQLTLVPSQPAARELAVSFEREFHPLAELSHPRVIAVYDYGVEHGQPYYYTMELLDGDDLTASAPLPWRDACAVMSDVFSSLALLHSRRLLRRDVSPRNVRRRRRPLRAVTIALAEAKLGGFEAAAARLDALIGEQRALGVHGLPLGASFEARTRVAIGVMEGGGGNHV